MLRFHPFVYILFTKQIFYIIICFVHRSGRNFIIIIMRREFLSKEYVTDRIPR